MAEQLTFGMSLAPAAKKRTKTTYHPADHPYRRLAEAGAGALSHTELIAALIEVNDDLAGRITERGWTYLYQLSAPELRAQFGITERQARILKAGMEIGRRSLADDSHRHQIKSPADVASLLMSEMAHLDQEHLRTVLLDTKNRVLEVATIYIGSVNSAMIRVGEVFKPAIRRNATALILAHNHPSGDPTPSPEDILITRQIVEAGKLMDCDVLDHLIIGRGRHVSMRERGLGFTSV